jgi:hypothetical protein
MYGSPDLQPTVTKNKNGGEIGTKLCLDSPWLIPFMQLCPFYKIVSGNPDLQPTWPPLLKIEGDEILKYFPLKLLGQFDLSFAKIILW